VPLFADPTYTVFQVPGAVSTGPTSINQFGTVTGNYTDTNGTQHGFVRDPSGTFTTFDVPGSAGTSPCCINIAGTIAGTWWDASGTGHSFMRDSKGTITKFEPRRFSESYATGINAEGAIVGLSWADGYGYVRYPNGTFTIPDGGLPIAINVTYLVTGPHGPGAFVGRPYGPFTPISLGHSLTWPTSINSLGAITGSYDTPDPYFGIHGFVRDPQGNIVTFYVGGDGEQTYPGAINDAGAVVGSSGSHAFVRDPQGTITVIDPQGSTSTSAADINDAGVITGNFSTDGGKTYAGFVRTP
jgi:hypothetical protein